MIVECKVHAQFLLEFAGLGTGSPEPRAVASLLLPAGHAECRAICIAHHAYHRAAIGGTSLRGAWAALARDFPPPTLSTPAADIRA